MCAVIRKIPPIVVTMAAGGMCRLVSPLSSTRRLGQQLSTQPVDTAGLASFSFATRPHSPSVHALSQVGSSDVIDSVWAGGARLASAVAMSFE